MSGSLARDTLPYRQALHYWLLGALLWVIVDWGTAGGFRCSYFTTHGPLLLAFYGGYPLMFTGLIFIGGWRGWRLFGATLAAMLFIEGALTGNPFVLSFPLLLVGIPLAVCVYAPLTYFPLWLVNGEMHRHKGLAVFLAAVIFAITFLTTFGG